MEAREEAREDTGRRRFIGTRRLPSPWAARISRSRDMSDRRVVNVGGTTFKVARRYTELKAIGRGSYGVVCSSADTERQRKVAIKRIRPMAAHTADAKHVLREVRLMRLLGAHDNVISMFDVFCNERDDELYIVMELLDSDLHRIIQSPQPLTDAHHRYFMYQLVRGVGYLHKHNIIHRDLKPGNRELPLSRPARPADTPKAGSSRRARARASLSLSLSLSLFPPPPQCSSRATASCASRTSVSRARSPKARPTWKARRATASCTR